MARFFLHTISGQVGPIEDHIAEHPTFAPYLVEVERGTKSFSPDLWKPKTADEYRESRKKPESKPEEIK